MRKSVKVVLGAGILAALISTPAASADMSVFETQSAYGWTGLYVGLVGGYGWATSEHIDTVGATSGEFDQDGFVVGGTVGYNWQQGDFVFGLEADLSYTDIDGTVVPTCIAPGCVTDIEAFGTIRPRIGFAIGNFLPYVTGGLAVAHLDYVQATSSGSGWEFGWTVGAGLEAQLTDNLSLKAEYLYADVSDGRYQGVAIPVNVREEEISIVRVGFNYRFGGSLF